MTVRAIQHTDTRETSSEDRRETGLSLIVIGFMLWFFDAFIFFFMPAGIKLGQKTGFALLTGSVLVLGAALIAIGVYLRKK